MRALTPWSSSHDAMAALAAASCSAGGVVVVVGAPPVAVVGGRRGRGLRLRRLRRQLRRAPAGSAARRSCRRARPPWRGPSRRAGRRRCRCPGGRSRGSTTPKLSTRLRMMSTATSSESGLYLPTGESTTEMPPWRSRPSTGVVARQRASRRTRRPTTTSVTDQEDDVPTHGSVVARAVVGGRARRATGRVDSARGGVRGLGDGVAGDRDHARPARPRARRGRRRARGWCRRSHRW